MSSAITRTMLGFVTVSDSAAAAGATEGGCPLVPRMTSSARVRATAAAAATTMVNVRERKMPGPTRVGSLTFGQ